MAAIEKGLSLATQPSSKFIVLPSDDASENSGSLLLRQALHVQRRTGASPNLSRIAAALAFAVPEKWGRK